jgi:hypothetical protein
MYFERQVGGNCRIHATNMLLGEARYTVGSFTDMATEFARRYDLPAGTAIAHDYVSEDGLLLPSFALECARPEWTTMTVTPGTAALLGYEEPLRHVFLAGLEDPDSPGVFVFHPGHIWAIRYGAAGSAAGSARSATLLDSMRGGPSPCPRPFQRATNEMYSLVFTAEGARTRLLPLLRSRLETKLASRDFPEPPRDPEVASDRTVAFACMGDIGLLLARLLRVVYNVVSRDEARRLSAAVRDCYSLARHAPLDFQERIVTLGRETLLHSGSGSASASASGSASDNASASGSASGSGSDKE